MSKVGLTNLLLPTAGWSGETDAPTGSATVSFGVEIVGLEGRFVTFGFTGTNTCSVKIWNRQTFTNWNTTTLQIVCEFVPQVLPSGDTLVLTVFDVSDAVKWAVYHRLAGTLELLRSGFADIIANTVSGNLTAGALYWLRITATTGTSGTIRIEILDSNLGSVFDSGDVPGNLGAGNYGYIRLGRNDQFAPSTGQFAFGVLIVDPDNGPVIEPGFVGGVKLVDADTLLAEWTPNVLESTMFEMLVNNPYDPATFVSTNGIGDEFLVDVESNDDAGFNDIDEILTVRPIFRGTSTGADTTLRTLVRSVATTIDNGSDLVCTATFPESYCLDLDTDPATSAAWTALGLDSLSLGARALEAVNTEIFDVFLTFLYYPVEAEGTSPSTDAATKALAARAFYPRRALMMG